MMGLYLRMEGTYLQANKKIHIFFIFLNKVFKQYVLEEKKSH